MPTDFSQHNILTAVQDAVVKLNIAILEMKIKAEVQDRCGPTHGY